MSASRATRQSTRPPGARTPRPPSSRKQVLYLPASRSGPRPSAGGAGGSTEAAFSAAGRKLGKHILVVHSRSDGTEAIYSFGSRKAAKV
eukprot:10659644-Alexandrium_andersonii.AAC.1